MSATLESFLADLERQRAEQQVVDDEAPARAVAPPTSGGLSPGLEQFLSTATSTVRQNRASAGALNLMQGRGDDPEAVGFAQRESARTGASQTVIEADPGGYEALRRQRDDGQLLQGSPKLAQWLANDPENARIAHDDVPELSVLDRLHNIRTAARRGTATDDFGELRYWTIFNDGQYANDATRIKAAQLRTQMGREGLPAGPVQTMLENTAELTAQFVEGAPTIAGGAMVGGIVGGTAGAVAGGAGAVPGFFAGMAAGGVAGAGAHAFQVEAGHAYDEFRQLRDVHGREVMEHEVAAGAALISGVINGGLEAFGVKLVGEAFGLDRVISRFSRDELARQLTKPTTRDALKTFFQNYTQAWGAEVGTEVLQEWVVVGMGELAKLASSGEFDTMTADEFWDRTIEIFTKVGSGMIIPAGLGAGVTLTTDMARVRQAEANQDYFTDLAEAAAASKTRTRNPDRFESYVNQASEPTPDLYIEAARFREYWQSQGVDMEQLALEFPLVREQAEAFANGGDLVIPTGTYAARIAGTEHHAGLVRHLRRGPNQASLAEAEQLTLEMRSELEQAAAAAQEQAEAEGRELEPADAVYEDIVRQQVEAGASPDVAAANAELYRSFYNALTQAPDAPSALDAYRRARLRVASEAAGTADPGDMLQGEIADEATGLPINPDGTVTVYHHTSPEAAEQIRETGQLQAEAEPDVYVTTRRETDTGYGTVAVPIRVRPETLQLDDEFPGGRRDFRIGTGAPGGAVAVVVDSDQGTAEDATRAEQPQADYDPSGADADATELGAAAEPGEPDAAVRGDRLPVLGSRIAADFAAGRAANLLGQPVETAGDVAVAAQVYRDPRYETFRTLYVRDGRVVHQTGVSSRQVGNAPAFVRGEDAESMFASMRDTIEATGADGYYLLHNHPSGNPSPSDSDVTVTRSIAEAVPGFLAHVVINDNQYAVLANLDVGDGLVNIETAVLELDEDAPATFGTEPSVPHPILGETVRGPDDVAGLAKYVQTTPGYLTILGTSRGQVSGISEIAPEDLDVTAGREATRLLARALQFARATGSQDLFLVGVPSEGPARTMAGVGISRGLLRDVILDNGESLVASGYRQRERLLRPGRQVEDEAADYAADPSGFNELGRVERVSTRVPSSAVPERNVGDPADNSTVVDLEVAPAAWRKRAADKLRAPFAPVTRTQKVKGRSVTSTKYEGYPERGLTDLDDDAAIERFVEFAKDNLLWLFDQVPAEIRDRSRLWYVGANRYAHALAGQHDITPEAAAGVIAALSPQKDWFENAATAERVVRIYRNHQDTAWTPEMTETMNRIFGGRGFASKREALEGRTLAEIGAEADLQGMWIRIYSQTYDPDGYPSLTPEGDLGPSPLTAAGQPSRLRWNSTAEVARAVEILNDPTHETISRALGSQHKVRSFYGNIISPGSIEAEVPGGQDITIDTHAVGAAMLRVVSTQSIEVANNFSAPSDRATGLAGMYAMYHEAYNRAAAERGVLPREMQSITWEAVRGLFPAAWKTDANRRQVDEVWARYQSEEIGRDEARREVLRLAGGIDQPFWVGQLSGAGRDEAGRGPADEGAVPGAGVPGGPAGQPGGDRAAAGAEGPDTAGVRGGRRELRQRTLEEYLAQEQTGSGQTGAGVVRGAIRLPERFGAGDITIRLFRQQNLSTFLHESGHLFLEAFRDAVQQDWATEAQRRDWQRIAEWLGISSDPSVEIPTEAHEKWARGFERYLREGRAPSSRLRRSFARFAAWLTSIYRDVRRLNVELDDEVRGVMDRMLATSEEIRDAETELNYDPLFSEAEAAGMNATELAAYRRRIAAAGAAARQSLYERSLAEVERERKRWWRDQLAVVRDQVRAELEAQPLYQAWHYLRTGEFLQGEKPERLEAKKLDRGSLVEAFGRGVLGLLPGRGANSVYQAKGGDHQDVVAEFFGISSGEELVQQLIDSEPLDLAVRREADRRMQAEYGDMMTDGSMQAAAMEEAHNDERLQVLETELIVLNRQSGVEQPRPRDLARQIAEAQLATKPVGEAVKSHLFLSAERRASRATERALLAGDYAEAARQKRQQLIQHHLYKASVAIAREVEVAQRRLGKYSRPGTRNAIADDYLDQIDALLEDYDFKAASAREVERREALSAFIARKELEGDELDIPDVLIDRARRTHYSRLRVDEYRALVDAVANLEHLGRLKGKLLLNQERREKDAIVHALQTEARANMTWHEEALDFAEPFYKGAQRRAQQFLAEHVKPEFLFERLGGGTVGTAWWDNLFKPLADAENAEQRWLETVRPQLDAAFGRYSRAERARWGRRIHVQGVAVFTKNSLLALALNWGNEGNRQAIRDGYGWTDSQVERALARLDGRDWDFVEDMWGIIDQFWPEIADLQKRTSGVVPPKVEASPFVAPGTTREIAGGYYPIAFDPERSWLAFKREQLTAGEELHRANFVRASTRKGHTHERVGSGGQAVLLDLSVASTHLTNVIHDLTHREALVYVDKLVSDRRVREAIEHTAGKEVYRTLRPWLAAIARDRRDPVQSWEHIVRRARHGATVVNMGWKFTTAMVQFLGYFQSVELLGERAAWRGLTSFYANPVKMGEKVRFVNERSVAVRNRQRTFDRDVRSQVETLKRGGLWNNVTQTYFSMIALGDASVVYPTWLGAYDKHLEATGDEQAAIDYADSVVRMSQSSGAPKDLAVIQSGGEYSRMFTMFYSYFSVLHNLLRRRKWNTTGIKDIPRFATSLVYLIVAPALLAEIILGRAPDEDEHTDEEIARWYARTVAGYPFQTFVGVRDIVGAATSDYGYGLTPVADVFEATASVAQGMVEGNWGKPTARAGVLTAGYWLQLPGRQAWLTGEYLYDWMSGEVDGFSPYEALVTGSPRD